MSRARASFRYCSSTADRTNAEAVAAVLGDVLRLADGQLEGS